MSNIKLVGHAVQGSAGLFGHLQVVFDDSFEIEVRPSQNWLLNGFDGGVWQYRINVSSLIGSEPESTAAFDLGGRNASNVWELLIQAANDIQNSGQILYDVNEQNSNTFINTLLLSVGVSANSYAISLDYIYPALQYSVIDQVTFNINGTSGEDWFFAGARNDTLNGGGGDDTLHGGDGTDMINGGDGDDILYGESGVDTIHGGADLDRIVGGGDDDKLYGDEGNDLIWGDAGKDELFGDEGDDNLYGGSGDDKLNGGEGDDELYAGADKDELIGGVGADRLDGGEGVDTVSYATSEEAVRVNLDTGVGSGGDAAGDNGGDTYVSIENVVGSDFDDVIIGNAGDNKLEGGDGADVLIGGDGKDELLGGDGADVLLVGRLRGDNPQGSSHVTETVKGGVGTDYLVVTSEEGATIIIDDGDVEDRLLIHESLLNTSLVSSEGDVPMFACSLKQKGTPCSVPFRFNL